MAQIRHGAAVSEFELEAGGLHLTVSVALEAIAHGDGAGRTRRAFARSLEDSQLQHFTGEIPTVEMHLQNGLVEILQLRHRESRR